MRNVGIKHSMINKVWNVRLTCEHAHVLGGTQLSASCLTQPTNHCIFRCLLGYKLAIQTPLVSFVDSGHACSITFPPSCFIRPAEFSGACMDATSLAGSTSRISFCFHPLILCVARRIIQSIRDLCLNWR